MVYTVTVSVMEIYNETVRDLLVDADVDASRKYQNVRFVHLCCGRHEIRHGASGTTIDDMTEMSVPSLDAVVQLMEIGRCNRTIASTRMNSDSSRSHRYDPIAYIICIASDCMYSLVMVKLVGENVKRADKVVNALYCSFIYS